MDCADLAHAAPMPKFEPVPSRRYIRARALVSQSLAPSPAGSLILQSCPGDACPVGVTWSFTYTRRSAAVTGTVLSARFIQVAMGRSGPSTPATMALACSDFPAMPAASIARR